MIFAAFLYAYGGLALLGLAMNRHYAQVWNTVPSSQTSRAFALGGWGLLAGSLLTSTVGLSWSIGVVAWIGALSAAALSLIFLLPYRPGAAAKLALVTAALATILILVR